ncbi:MAG: PEP/pyruvate-binding domain-containing protein [bacterium]
MKDNSPGPPEHTGDGQFDEMPLPQLSRKREEVFAGLMPFRVREILLVSSLYDAYILEEDGRLTDLIAAEYRALNLPYAPNVTRVSTGEQGLEEIGIGKYDLVITQMRLGYMDPAEFAREAKLRAPDLPVVMLAYETRELRLIMERPGADAFDEVFVWHGDGTILLAIVKYIEDRKNSEHDIKQGGVPVIILVEDSISFYSSYLPTIYTELVNQIQTVVSEEPTLALKVNRTRARPKVLLATTFEKAWSLFQEYRHNLLGIISDVRFPKGGKVDFSAGLELTRQVRAAYEDLPILLQSRQESYAHDAAELQVAFIRKDSHSLLHQLRRFIIDNFGFGDFVFYLPDGQEVGRAHNLFTMERVLRDVPAESIQWHGERNHFSRWLMARTEFELAHHLRAYNVTGFESIEKVRSFLINSLSSLCREAHAGVVTAYSLEQCREHSTFMRIGSGSLGGKARGLAFMHSLFERYGIRERFEDVDLHVPRTAVITTDYFDEFLDRNNLRDLALADTANQQIVEAFLSDQVVFDLPPEIELYIDQPLAIRSSSLLEDALYQPFAGTYATLMLPNNDPDPRVRRKHLSQAIRYVYASAFFQQAKAYIDATPNRVEEEKMAVLIQELVGSRHGNYYYPHIGGIARSYNYYPVGPQKPDDGAAHVVLGLGTRVVEGGLALRFSPVNPQVVGQFSNLENTLRNAQKQFNALDLTKPFIPDENYHYLNVVELDLAAAEQHGTLWPVGSVYSPENDMIYDGIDRPGARLVTFAHILKSEIFPLAKILDLLLNFGSAVMSCPVEIEFAVDLEPPAGQPKRFGFLQMRPLVVGREHEDVDLSDFGERHVVCFSSRALGNGRIHDVHDIVYVRPETFKPALTRTIAQEVGALNRRLRDSDTPYVLIGPGRWGSSDSWLGVPVTWSQISGARIIIETSLEGFVIEPSQGSHFFQNLTSFNVGYFSVDPHAQRDCIDWEWLAQQQQVSETEHLRHVRIERELEIRIDGRSSSGAILLDKK